MYTESTVCLTPPSIASIRLVALLKPVPVLNFDFSMFIFQKPIWGLPAWPARRATAATKHAMPAATDDRVMLPLAAESTTLLTLRSEGYRLLGVLKRPVVVALFCAVLSVAADGGQGAPQTDWDKY